MSEFDGPSILIPQAIYGTRAFHVQSDGDLLSPLQSSFTWKPGVNHADCVHSDIRNRMKRFGLDSDGGHRVPDKDCSCGFYAYHNNKFNPYANDDFAVETIIEGTGKALVGSKGFRVERAEIKAVCMPQHLAPAPKFPAKHIGTAAGIGFPISMAVATFVFTWAATLSGPSAVFAYMLAIALLLLAGTLVYKVLWNLSYMVSPDRAGGSRVRATMFDNIKKKYPDIQVFETRAQMVKAFPSLGNAVEIVKDVKHVTQDS